MTGIIIALIIYSAALTAIVIASFEMMFRKMQHQIRRLAMSTKDQLDALNAQLAQNTSVTNSAKMALDTYLKTVADLTDQLSKAHSDDDGPAIESAIAALKANNDALSAAVPATAAAVSAGTTAAGT